MDARTPNRFLAVPADAPMRDGDAASAITNDAAKEVTSNARQEEGRSQATRQDPEPRESAEARRGRRRQERLTTLMCPWWEADPGVLASELKGLASAGYVLVHQGVERGHVLRLELKRARRRFELVFDENYRSGGYVVARELLHPGTELKTAERRAISLGRGPAGALSALHRIHDRVFDIADIGHWGRVLLPSAWGRKPKAGHGTLEFAVAASGISMVPISITGVDDAASRELASVSTDYRRAFPRKLHGLWVAASDAHSRKVSLPDHIEQRLAAAHGIGISALRTRLRVDVGALWVPDRFFSTWHFVYRSSNDELRQMETMWCDANFYPERAPHARALEGRRVALVGCGAVGWPVAVMLARSGVRRFTIFDDDKIAPHNLARLGAFITDAGTYKVQTLAAQLEAVAPGIEVDQFTVEVGRHVGAAALADARPDLLINLTGEERSTDETNLAALRLGVPALFAWVSRGVVAARIFRVRPFESACYECVRESAPATIRAYGRTRGEFFPWTGSIVDVEAFAAVVAQTAIRTLRRLPASHWNPDHVLLDFGGLTPRARRVDIARDPRCRVCR
jgi:molybdopterin/thiamine biosynthesis adenylyltransferase